MLVVLWFWNISVSCHIEPEICVYQTSPTFPDLKHEQGANFSPSTVSLQLTPLDMSCLHVLKWKCACAEKRGIVWLHTVHDLNNLFSGCIYKLSKYTMYLFQVKKEKKQAWKTFYHRTKVEKLFLRKEVLEWLNPSLPDLLLDCLSCSHFSCTYRFCMKITP